MYASFTDSVHLLSLGSDPPRSCSAALSLSLHSASLSGRLSSTALKLAFGAAEKLCRRFFSSSDQRREVQVNQARAKMADRLKTLGSLPAPPASPTHSATGGCIKLLFQHQIPRAM